MLDKSAEEANKREQERRRIMAEQDASLDSQRLEIIEELRRIRHRIETWPNVDASLGWHGHHRPVLNRRAAVEISKAIVMLSSDAPPSM
jgi:hypothetical protein